MSFNIRTLAHASLVTALGSACAYAADAQPDWSLQLGVGQLAPGVRIRSRCATRLELQEAAGTKP